jgi:ribonuclease PH
MEGHMTEEELSQSLDLGVQGCRAIYEKMKQALRERYATGPIGGSA